MTANVTTGRSTPGPFEQASDSEDQRCACAPPHGICLYHFGILVPRDQDKWLRRLRIRGSDPDRWWNRA